MFEDLAIRMAQHMFTKFALEGLSESLAYEVEPLGIKIVLVEPGFVRTNFPSGIKGSNINAAPAVPTNFKKSTRDTMYTKKFM